MLTYILLVAVMNLGLGFALAVYLGRPLAGDREMPDPHPGGVDASATASTDLFKVVSSTR